MRRTEISLIVVIITLLTAPRVISECGGWEHIRIPSAEFHGMDVREVATWLETFGRGVGGSTSNFSIKFVSSKPIDRSITFGVTHATMDEAVWLLAQQADLGEIHTPDGPLLCGQAHAQEEGVICFEGRITDAAHGGSVTGATMVAKYGDSEHETQTVVSGNGEYICLVPVSWTRPLLITGRVCVEQRTEMRFKEITGLKISSPGYQSRSILLTGGVDCVKSHLDISLEPESREDSSGGTTIGSETSAGEPVGCQKSSADLK